MGGEGRGQCPLVREHCLKLVILVRPHVFGWEAVRIFAWLTYPAVDGARPQSPLHPPRFRHGQASFMKVGPLVIIRTTVLMFRLSGS